MGLLKEFIGPKSKYLNELPYTYEARIKVMEGEYEYNSYLSDTLCGLIDHLIKKKIRPDEVSLHEIFKEEEKGIDVSMCINDEGDWLQVPELCRSFKEHYPGHIYADGCTFDDRDKKCVGP